MIAFHVVTVLIVRVRFVEPIGHQSRRIVIFSSAAA
jgi:hypothetical protein